MKNITKSILKNLYILIICLALLASGYFIYEIYQSVSIGEWLDKFLISRYFIASIIVVTIVILCLLLISESLKAKKISVVIISILVLIFSSGAVYGAIQINGIDKSLNNFVNKTKTETVSVSFVTINSSSFAESGSVDGARVGLKNNQTSRNGYIVPVEYLNSAAPSEIKSQYATESEQLHALLNGEVDIIALPLEYQHIFENDTLLNEQVPNLVTVTTYSKEFEVSGVQQDLNSEQPFTILLIGTDTPLESIDDKYLFDTIVIATIDPQSSNVVITSIPRDMTLYSECIGGYDKVTHNGGYGINCLESTLEGTFDIVIDYYMMIDFGGVLNIVNYLGGIYIDNPYGTFKEQDSNRYANRITVPAGYNLLAGEQALAFSRNRKHVGYDCTVCSIDANERSANNAQVISSIITRMKEQNVFLDLNSFISVLTASTLTNFPFDNIVTLTDTASLFLQNEPYFKTLTLDGYNYTFNSPAAGGQALSGTKPYQESIDYISKSINMVYYRRYENLDASFSLTIAE